MVYENDFIKVVVTDLARHFFKKSYVSYINENFKEDELRFFAIKDDYLTFKILIFSKERKLDLSLNKNLFKSNKDFISAIDIGLIDETLASIGRGFVWNSMPDFPKKSVPDVIKRTSKVKLDEYCLSSFFVGVYVGKDKCEGFYKSKFRLFYNDLFVDIPLSFEVFDESVDDDFYLNLWQYPFSSLRYYKIDSPFSKEHISILENHLREYKKCGGSSITTTIMDEAWMHQTYDAYPSMVRKNLDKTFDFSFFDSYVNLCRSLDVDKEIMAFSLASWDNFNKEDENYRDDNFLSANWKAYWARFLKSFISHLDDRGIFDITYIALDERPIDVVEEVLNFLSSFKNKDGKCLKVSALINYKATSYEILDRIDHLSLSMDMIDEDFLAYLKKRKDNNLRTTMYTMVGQFPNSFALNEPIETSWVIFYAYNLGFDGFLRWAYDAWVKDPLKDISHWWWEAGDPFFIYPSDDKSTYPLSSPRFENLKRAIKMVKLIKNLEKTIPKEVFSPLKERLDMLTKPKGVINSYNAMVSPSNFTNKALRNEIREIYKAIYDILKAR